MRNMSTLKEKAVSSAAACIFLTLFFIAASATTASAVGTIVIVEQAFPDSPHSFGFSATGQVSQNFSLVDNGLVGPDRITFSNVPAGLTTVTQNSLPYPYTLTNMSCGVSGGGGSNTAANVPARLVNINLADGDTVTCTFGDNIAGVIVDTTSDTDFTSVNGCQFGAPPNTCSLRTAILYANADPFGPTQIVFVIPTSDPGYDAGADRYTITLTSALPALAADTVIYGPGAKRVTVKRGVAAAFRIFTINSGATVSIIGLNISHGFADEGGGIRNAGTLS